MFLWDCCLNIKIILLNFYVIEKNVILKEDWVYLIVYR